MLTIDHARINAAIAKAEHNTSGEITCIIRRKPLAYPETPLMWAIGTAFILPIVLAVFGWWPQDELIKLLPNSFLTWQSGHEALNKIQRIEATAIFILMQLIIFGLVYLVVSVHPIRLWLTPRAIIVKRAHEKAMEQFKARGLHLTQGQTGVLIFCALEEHFVEVIADEGIYSKVDKSLWNETIATLLKHIKSGDLTTGFEAAIVKCGDALSIHFPPDAINHNELPDVLIEI